MLHKVTTVNGHNLLEVVSAFQKCIRRSMLDDALYFGVDLALSGFAEFAWSRMLVIVSEDVGPASPGLVSEIRALRDNYIELAKKKNKHAPERLPFVHAIVLLATSAKSRLIDNALTVHFRRHRELRREVPDWARDVHTPAGRRLGRGYKHFMEEGAKLVGEVGDDPYRQLAIDALMNPPADEEPAPGPDELF